MTSTELIESYLFNMGRDFTSPEAGVWIIHDDYDHIDNIVVVDSGPVITFRIKLMDAPDGESTHELFKLLLELNATEMVAGAYGLEDNAIVIVDNLQTENLDQNEIEAVIDGISMAISLHYNRLSAFRSSNDASDADPDMAAFDKRLDSAAAEA